MINTAIADFNDMLLKQVEEADPGQERIHFVPVDDKWREGNHGLCGKGEDWLNGLTTLRQGRGSFHPNQRGYAAEAELVAEMVRRLRWPPPAETSIAFAGDQTGDYEIYLVQPDGTSESQITTYSTSEIVPTWSPDGSQIAFTRQFDRSEPESGSPGVYVIDRAGTNLRRLTDEPGDNYPSWSPDGARLAFTRQRRNPRDLWVMNADGSAQTQLTKYTGDVGAVGPTWSPDGKGIAFEHYGPGDGNISIVDADGTGHVRVTIDAMRSTSPSWSPDGTKIVFCSWINNEEVSIVVIGVDGSGRTQLTPVSGNDRDPSWSPDGENIAFVSYRTGAAQIFVMAADGGEQRQVTKGPASHNYPAWGPG